MILTSYILHLAADGLTLCIPGILHAFCRLLIFISRYSFKNKNILHEYRQFYDF